MTDKSKQQMSELRRMMAQLERGELLGLQDSMPSDGYSPTEVPSGYIDSLFNVSEPERVEYSGFVIEDTPEQGMMGPSPYKGVATTEERFDPTSPPGGDYDHYTWVPTMGWQYTGSESDGTAGMSSYINSQGQRVHHDPVDTFQRDPENWDLERPLHFAEQAWREGGDLYLEEGARYNRETNPYEHIYDPVREAQAAGQVGRGAGPRGGTRQTVYRAGMTDAQRKAAQDRKYTGFEQFTPEGHAAVAAAGGRAPFGGLFMQDIDPLLGILGGDQYNPFYGEITQDLIDSNRKLGIIGDELTAYERRSENNVMDYLYNSLRGADQVKNRGAVMDRWKQYLNDMDLEADHFYNVGMNQRLFDRLGLEEFGMEFDPEFSKRPMLAGGDPNATSGAGMMGENPLTQAKSGGFLEAYLKKREENKPSVMSLMDEMKDF